MYSQLTDSVHTYIHTYIHTYMKCTVISGCWTPNITTTTTHHTVAAVSICNGERAGPLPSEEVEAVGEGTGEESTTV